MPSSHEEHVRYTSTEWLNEPYFCNLINYLKEKNIESIIDVGANVGEASNVLINKVKSIKAAYLFEPEQSNYNFMCKKFKQNNKITLFNFGIYYGLKKSKLYRCDDNVGGFSIEKIGFYETEEIELKTLEEFSNGTYEGAGFDLEWVPNNCSSVPLSPFVWTLNTDCQATITMIVSMFH
jgi:FkbM family methyltransferase